MTHDEYVNVLGIAVRKVGTIVLAAEKLRRFGAVSYSELNPEQKAEWQAYVTAVANGEKP